MSFQVLLLNGSSHYNLIVEEEDFCDVYYFHVSVFLKTFGKMTASINSFVPETISAKYH